MVELLLIKKVNIRRSLFKKIDVEAYNIIVKAKDEDLMVLDIFIESDGFSIDRARPYTREVFDDILAGR